MEVLNFFRHRLVQLSIAVLGTLLLGTVVLAWHAAAPSLDSTSGDVQSKNPGALSVNTANVLGLGESTGNVNLQGQTTTTVQASTTLQTQPAAPSPQTAGGVPATR